MIFAREIQKNVTKDFFKGKVIILAGARQVGKTTLVQAIITTQKKSVLTLNADDPIDREKLENKNIEQLKKLVEKSDILFIDEAQKISGIGTTLKLMVDYFKKKKQIIATGSSSLNLLSNTQEALTGRKYVYMLYGLSVREIAPTLDEIYFEKILSDLLIFGSYPEVFANRDERSRLLREITSSYLYQDVLSLEQVRNPAVLQKLLSALALQLGSEVSNNELSNLLGIDTKTVERYIDLLEKNFVIFRLVPYATNARKTLSKLNKIYFYDLGVRNAVINNLNPLDLRSDVGALWENFLLIERMKLRQYHHRDASQFFWRTYDGAEIDLVEQREGKLFGYEIKWGKKRTSPKSWLEYPNAQYEVVHKDNYLKFLTA